MQTEKYVKEPNSAPVCGVLWHQIKLLMYICFTVQDTVVQLFYVSEYSKINCKLWHILPKKSSYSGLPSQIDKKIGTKHYSDTLIWACFECFFLNC